MSKQQRQKRKRVGNSALAVTGLAASAAAGGLGALLSSPAGAATPAKIYACYNTKTFALTYLNYPKVTKCPTGNDQISWNAVGPQGAKGAQGARGSNGNPGSQGPQGSQGSPGAQGSQGSTGSVGNAGNPGNPGSQGSQGAQGAQGAQGSAGPQGVQGAQGAQGFQGSQGSQGSQGGQGSQGSQGAVGVQGSQGSQGAVGSQGSQGSQGAGGAQGSQGAQGAQGVAGAQGTLNDPAYYHYVQNTTTGTVINYAPTVVAAPVAASGQYFVTATATVKDGSTGSTQFSCWLRDLSISRSSDRPVRSTPGQYVTAYGQHPTTVAVTGYLVASRSSDPQMVCELHNHGSGVRVTNLDLVMSKVSSGTANAPKRPANKFVKVPGARHTRTTG